MVNKKELTSRIAEETEMTKKDVEIFVKSFIEQISVALENGEKVQLVGFGTFEARQREERKGRNPKTKEEIIIAARKAPVFKAGKEFKERVNK